MFHTECGPCANLFWTDAGTLVGHETAEKMYVTFKKCKLSFVHDMLIKDVYHISIKSDINTWELILQDTNF